MAPSVQTNAVKTERSYCQQAAGKLNGKWDEWSSRYLSAGFLPKKLESVKNVHLRTADRIIIITEILLKELEPD